MGKFWGYDYSKGVAPCKNCKDRYIGCHAKCKKFKEFRRKLNETKGL